jgi:aldehyde:ferredoxin oxidoreductase
MVLEAYNKQILWIDLTEQTTRIENLEEDIYKKFIGGRGLGTYLLYRELEPGIDPLSPDNILFFLSGPLQGLPAPSVGRWALVTKSPLTGFYLDSYCGAALGREIKKAGFDAICVKGKAELPTTLHIKDNSIEFLSARDIWGLGVYKATKILREQSEKGSSIYMIGPAGENQVLCATACCDIAHQTGRGGAGAVLGSKNLKAVIAKGNGIVNAYDVDTIREINKSTAKLWKTSELAFADYGTPAAVELANTLGQYPTRNWQNGYFDEYKKLDPAIMIENWGLGRHHSCPQCVMQCTHAFKTNDPDDSSSEVESMIEYETLGFMGGNIGNSDPELAFKLNYLCDNLGLDTITTGSIIGFAMEAYEKGILTEEEIGFTLNFGDGDAAIKIIKMIAAKEGIGETLSKGVKKAANEIGNGSEAFAVHVKGLETAAWDPRGRKGMGLSYATAAVGSSHLRGWPDTTDPPIESGLDMVESMIQSRAEKILKDSLVICHFTFRLPLTYPQIISLYNAATGVNYNESDVSLFAQRVETLSRLFNIREGASRKDDQLPPRFWEPQTHGPRKGMISYINKDDFDACLDLFYKLRGWDMSGTPKDETLEHLGLSEIVK